MYTLPEYGSVEKHVLLTSLSSYPKDGIYFLDGKTAAANQSPLALLQLLPPERLPQEIIVLCTEKLMEEQFSRLKESVEFEIFSGGRIGVKSLFIPDGKTVEELWQTLHLILEAVPPGCRLTLDLTHGYRSFPFIFFTAALYLKALRSVCIEAVYYAMFDVMEEEKPIVDLSLILDIVEWFYAVRTFSETGQTSHLTAMLAAFEKCPAGLQGDARRPYKQMEGLRKSFESVAAAYMQALPLEFGAVAAGLLNKLKAPLPEHLQEKVPLPGELFGEIRSFIEPFAFPGRRKNKAGIPLDKQELARQAGIIDTCLRQGHINHAIGLIREWIVSAAMFSQSGVEQIEGREWLKYDGGKKGRRFVERRLSLLMELLTSKGLPGIQLTVGQTWLAGQWQFLAARRNDLHHHGFKVDNALLDEKKISEIWERWAEIKDSLGDVAKWRLDLVPERLNEPGGWVAAGEAPAVAKCGTLLVSPLGLSKGLLYSALRHVRPGSLLVISSPDAAACLDEIMEKVGWCGNRMIRLMQDPHAGFNELGLFSKDILPVIMQADEMVVNITGGTTAMQHIVQQIAGYAEELGRLVRRVALVDRRLPQEQRDDPYVPGELIRLD
jgi:CRISPR-associated Csx2 family protein